MVTLILQGVHVNLKTILITIILFYRCIQVYAPTIGILEASFIQNLHFSSSAHLTKCSQSALLVVKIVSVPIDLFFLIHFKYLFFFKKTNAAGVNK